MKRRLLLHSEAYFSSTSAGLLAQGLDWVWEMVKLAVAPGLPPDKDIPRILFYEELDHMDKASWLGLEAALVATDRCSALLPAY